MRHCSRLFFCCPTAQSEPPPKDLLAEQCRLHPDYGREFLDHYSHIYGKVAPRVRFGDNTDRLDRPTLVKTRRIGDPNGILLPLNRARHWDYTAELATADIPFAKKKMAVVWRGTTTGKSKDGFKFGEQPRTRLVRTWKGKRPDINVCYSAVTQGKDKQCAGLVGKPMTMKQQLGYALVVAVEGNDVASNLKWILASNSVPVMPPPRFESWLLESQLAPFVHYLPVRPDFADLAAALEWAKAHPAECAAMAKEGQKFVKSRGLSPRLERAIIRRFLGLDGYNVTHPPRKDEQMLARRAHARAAARPTRKPRDGPV